MTLNPTRTLLMPPTPVSRAPRTSHDAADTVGIQSDHRAKSMRTSYTDAGVAVDGCSTLHDTEADMTRKVLPTVALQREFAKNEPPRRRSARKDNVHDEIVALDGRRPP